MKNEIEIGGVTYMRKRALSTFHLIRSADSGVHFGCLESREGSEVTMTMARRLWKWSGAFTLNEIATAGVTDPDGCKFSSFVPRITVLGVCEIIPVSKEAAEIIADVKTHEP